MRHHATTLPLLLLLIAGCAPGTTSVSPGTSVKPNDTVTIKGKVRDAAGKPVTTGTIRLGTVKADLTKLFTDQSAAGELGTLGADGAFSYTRKGYETNDGGKVATHTILVETPDGAMARHSFFPTKVSNVLADLKLWDGMKVRVDDATGATTIAITPPPDAPLGVDTRIYRGDALVWETFWEAKNTKTLPSYVFDEGVTYRVQGQTQGGATLFKSPYHDFTGSAAGREGVLPIVSAKNERGEDLPGLIDGKTTPNTSTLELAGPQEPYKTATFDLGSSKSVGTVVLLRIVNAVEVVIGDAADGKGGKAFKAREIPTWQVVDCKAKGRYVRVEWQGKATWTTESEVRIAAP